MMVETRLEPGSFRDRHGRVFYVGEDVFRGLSAKALADWELLSNTRFFGKLTDEGSIVGSRLVDSHPSTPPASDWAAVLQHDRIPFVSYPYEWAFSMLKDAAELQLRLLQEALAEDLILKDATSYNVQWRGSQPVFIDVASFEPYRQGEPWSGYRQFCQLFLYPLQLQAHKNLSFHGWLRGSLEGIDSEDLAAVMSWRDRLRSGIFLHVYMQAKMQQRYRQRDQDARRQIRKAGFNRDLIVANIRGLQKLVKSLHWGQSDSTWSDYAGDNSYTQDDHLSKLDFVDQAAAAVAPALVWDLGANTGVFSRVAAEHARYVVAMDADHLAVERHYAALKKEGNRKILPLVNNLADPSPPLGWNGCERKSLPERGKPDLILALALIHHVVISANIPLQDFVSWLAEQSKAVVIEFVTKADPMVKTLLRNKDDQYEDYEQSFFETQVEQHFEIVRRLDLGSDTRTLYFLRQRR